LSSMLNQTPFFTGLIVLWDESTLMLFIYLFILYCVVRMAERKFIFEVHYGGKMSRGFMCTYVGDDVDMYNETYDQDKLCFFEVERIVKKYRYKPRYLVYYLVPAYSLQNSLRLISSDHDVLEMVGTHKGTPIVKFYLVSFHECRTNKDNYDEYDDYGGNGGHSRIDRDDPY